MFLHTQRGNNNPYNQDNETTWLDWDKLERNREIFRFFKGMIAFRKSRRMIGRSRFWREDVRWYGAEGEPDLSHESRSLAYRLSGERFGESDLYVMINATENALRFRIQEGEAGDWLRVADTSLPSPQDIAEAGNDIPLASLDYEVGARSVVVLTRRRPTGRAEMRNDRASASTIGSKSQRRKDRASTGKPIQA